MCAWIDHRARAVQAAIALMLAAAGSLAGAQPVGDLPPARYPPVMPTIAATQPPQNVVRPAPTPRRPLARLVRNPNASAGQPPYALTDQTGAIQRYVEPVPGIDLEPYVDQVIVVRHDTGRTLLATQLELSPLPLLPMVGSAAAGQAIAPPSPPRPATRSDQLVQQVQFADDDLTVQLLDEGPETYWPQPEAASGPTDYPSAGYPSFPGGYPSFPGSMPSMGGPAATPYYAPQHYGQGAMEYYSGGSDCYPCPGCAACQQVPAGPHGHLIREPQRITHFYAEAEFNFLRAHVMEDAFGKLSERFELSPRFTIGFHDLENLSGRFRYWHYDHPTRVLGDDGSIRLFFDVWDMEATHHFAGRRTEVLLAAGVRLARLKLTDPAGLQARALLPGLTMAVDGRTTLCPFEEGRFGWVYGGRLSILGADWHGDAGNAFTNRRQDDNIVVRELYTGLQYAQAFRNFDFYARAAFEMQNWHSDALAQNAGTDSIGFIGPGLRLGVEF